MLVLGGVGLAGAHSQVRGHVLSPELEAPQPWEASAAPGNPALSIYGRPAVYLLAAEGTHINNTQRRLPTSLQAACFLSWRFRQSQESWLVVSLSVGVKIRWCHRREA